MSLLVPELTWSTDPAHQYHRAHFLEVLLERLPKKVPQLGKRLISYTESKAAGTIELQFADGTSATCDVLIGSDGIKSAVRKEMFQQLANQGQPDMLKYIEPVWTGEIVYRGLIPSENVPLNAGQKHRILTRSTLVSRCRLCVPHLIHSDFNSFVGTTK